ncbi:MAG: hypothetical protein AB8H47_15700 [Bacteroidia bacterium]
MQRFLQRLIPNWLKRLDQSWLIKSPAVWATKVHYVGFFLLIVYGLASLWTAIVPINTQDVPDPGIYFGLPILPLLIGFGFWVYKVSQFKREKQFGKAESSKTVQEQAIYLLVIAMFSFIPLSLNYQMSQRVANMVSDDTLIAEINHLNVASNFFRNDPEDINGEERGCSFEERCFARFYYYGWPKKAIKKAEENREIFTQSLQSPNQDQQEAIELYLEIVNQYSSFPLQIEAKKVLNNFQEEPQLGVYENYGDYMLSTVERIVETNLDMLRQAKAGDTHFLTVQYLGAIVSFLLWSLVFLMVLFKLGGRVFWASIGIIPFIWALVGSSSWTFGLLATLLPLLYWYTWKSKGYKLTKKLTASLFIVALLFLPVSVFAVVDWLVSTRISYEIAIIAGPILVLVLWNLGLNNRISKLEASPKTR